MKKQLLIFGVLAGVINMIGWVLNHWLFSNSTDVTDGELVGYIAMILSFTMIYFGVKKHRDQLGEGAFTFRQGLTNGLIIVLVSSTLYVIGWEIYQPNFIPDFYDQYYSQSLEDMRIAGATESELQIKQDEIDSWKASFENPFIRIPLTFMEIFPIGLIIALFCALILRRKPSGA